MKYILCPYYPTAVLKKHWWKNNEQKKLFSKYGFWTCNDLKYPKIKCLGEGFFDIFIFSKDFHCKVGNFRYLKYLAKISSIIEKNPPKIKILYKPSPKHFILGYFRLFHVQKPYWLNSFFCSLCFHQCFFKTPVRARPIYNCKV